MGVVNWLKGCFWPVLPVSWLDEPPRADRYNVDLEMMSSSAPLYYDRYGLPVYAGPEGYPLPPGEIPRYATTIDAPVLPLQHVPQPRPPWPEDGCDVMSWVWLWLGSFVLDGFLVMIICFGTIQGGFL